MEDCPGSSSSWHVVLLVDANERSNPHIKCMPREELVGRINHAFGPFSSSSDSIKVVHCETKHLLAGDYMWIARIQEKENPVLDCIIERKVVISNSLVRNVF